MGIFLSFLFLSVKLSKMNFDLSIIMYSEGGTGENQRIDPHLNFGILHRKQ